MHIRLLGPLDVVDASGASVAVSGVRPALTRDGVDLRRFARLDPTGLEPRQ